MWDWLCPRANWHYACSFWCPGGLLGLQLHHKDGETPKHKQSLKSPPLSSPNPSNDSKPKQQAQLDELLAKYKDMFDGDERVTLRP